MDGHTKVKSKELDQQNSDRDLEDLFALPIRGIPSAELIPVSIRRGWLWGVQGGRCDLINVRF